MTGFRAFLGKELREIVRTWRIWVIPGLLFFFAVSSPFVALLTPTLVSSLASGQPGVVIQLPDPTARDAFGQFLKSLSQIALIAVIITGAGAVSAERSTGTAVLVLTKPLSRAAFVVAKIVSQAALLVAATLVATLLTIGVTALVFPSPPVAGFVLAVALWLAFALLLVAVMVVFSVLLPSRGGAAGAGLAFFFVVLLAGTWPRLAAISFAGLPGAAGRALAGEPVAVAWPVATAGVALLAAAAGAVAAFRRQEL